MHDFTPVASALGGLLIGLAASALFLGTGRIAGISNICGGVVRPRRGELGWQAMFLLGMCAGGVILAVLRPGWFTAGITRSSWAIVGAGLLVGFGTRLANGCTSGHGLCGISRLSGRSIVATLTFMGVGAAVVFAVRHAFGGAL